MIAAARLSLRSEPESRLSDTLKGARASSQLYSLVEKASGQEPDAWLRLALERLPLSSTVKDFKTLLPWNCKPEIPR